MKKFLKLPYSVIFSILVIISSIAIGAYQDPETFVPVLGFFLLTASILRIFIYLMRTESHKIWKAERHGNEES